ncbi:MAG: DUF2341 domain-containing protein, partial [Bacilli bacterium]
MVLFSPRWKHSRRIDYSGCDQAAHQQDLVIHRTAGRDYEEAAGGIKIWHIFIGPKCRQDYGDLRFAGGNARELSYYLLPDYDSTAARFAVWLEGATGGGVLEVHYGNPSATTTSDPAVLPTVYTETGSHTYTVPAGVSSVAVLIVGGGGGGAGRDVSGGGGAGGLIFRPGYTVTPGSTLTVDVGAGGAGGVDYAATPIPNSSGENGGNSTFGDLTALGGGGGGYYLASGISGGSGGGAGREGIPNVGGSALQPGSESGGYGNPGGRGSGGAGTSDAGGGGGGAGMPGTNGVVNKGGNGGQGLSAVTVGETEYSFAAVFAGLEAGHIVDGDSYFAGGGGGSTHRSGTANIGIGGAGGGGSAATGNGINGSPNTGGGGGAGRGTLNHGGAGGSGVIIIRAYSSTPPSLLGTYRGILPPPIQGYLGSRIISRYLSLLYDLEIGATGKPIEVLYHLLRAQDLATIYQIRRHQDLGAAYQIEVLKDLLTTYHILIKQEALLPYDIPGGVTFTLVYSVLAEAVLDYRINVGDQVYDPERFWDLVITRKLNQVHTAVFELWTEGADVSDVVEGETLRIFYNDEVRFDGEIRSVKRDDMTGIWSVTCESGACRIADDAVDTVVDYQATPGDTILRAVLPSSEWEGTIDTAPAIDYRQEYADSLSHVSNLASVLGYDWRVRQQEDRYQVTGRTETTITVAAAGWPTSPQALAGRVVVVTSGTAKFQAAIVVSHTADTLTFSGTTWIAAGLKVGDSFRVFGPFRLDCRARIGAATARKTFEVNTDLFDSSTSRDLERVANAIVVPGTASITQDRNSTIAGNTLTWTTVTVTETILRLSLASDATTVPVNSTASFPSSGTVQIEGEKIAYTEKTATSFTGCTRGYAGTAPAAHNLQTEVVLVSSLPV